SVVAIAFRGLLLAPAPALEATIVRSVRVALFTMFACMTALTAHAQDASAVGVKAGVSGSPGQFYAGLHYESAPFAGQLRFRPNIEIGVGGDQTLIALNFELAYYVPLETGRRGRNARAEWTAYVGGGPALVIDRFTNDTSTGGGFNILVGAQ